MTEIEPGVFLFRDALTEEAKAIILDGVATVAEQSPFRRYRVKTGQMQIDMTNCGALGWVADTRGYRYEPVDPMTNKPWPSMPGGWFNLALCFARLAGFPEFGPDACLINRYQGYAKLGLHVDKDEAPEVRDQPIVSFSFGAAARFTLGGLKRSDPISELLLEDGDVLVMGGPGRLRYHGIRRVMTKDRDRINLTFRRAR